MLSDLSTFLWSQRKFLFVFIFHVIFLCTKQNDISVTYNELSLNILFSNSVMADTFIIFNLLISIIENER